MRTVTFGAACSLDGYITDRDGGIDWLYFSKDAERVIREYWTSIDTVVMGRKTWEVAARQGGGGKGGTSPGMQSFILSRTLVPAEHPGCQIISEDAGTFVQRLKQLPGKGICVMGGGELAQSLFATGVIDEVGLNIHPLLLGAGVPLFRDAGRRVPLSLLECRTLEGGCVLATYRVLAQPPT